MAGKSPFAGSSDLLALGCALRELRMRRGLLQQAVVFDAGVSKGYVSEIEQGYLNPSLVTLLRIARTLGYSLAELVDLYQQNLDVIDPNAGHDVPLCPTPEALEHVRRVSDRTLAAYYAAKARKARGRIKPWT